MTVSDIRGRSALGALNPLLRFGVIRRLRIDTRQDSGLNGAELSASMVPVGTPVPDTTIGWRGETLVGFFLPDCRPCEQQLPDFIAYARTRERVVAVVLDLVGNAAELVRDMEQVSANGHSILDLAERAARVPA